MPELPEVETVARSLRRRLVGRSIVRVETSGLRLRRPVAAGRLARLCVGAAVQGIERIGKYLLIELSSDSTLLVHLGMSGQLTIAAGDTPRPRHAHVVFRLDGGEELRFVDTRRFGLVLVGTRAEVRRTVALEGLGPDPLAGEFTAERLYASLRQGRSPVKSFLLDQRRLAGLGNIYAAEALFAAGISPGKRSDRLTRDEAERLALAVRAVLRIAIERRGTSFRDFVDGDGTAGENQAFLAVYGRAGEPCPRCGEKIRRRVQAGRSTFYCPRCQR